MSLLSQIPAPASGSIENWLLSAAAIASMAVLAKKLFLRKPAETEFVTKTEFLQEVSTLRDKIDARFLTLLEKLNEAKGELLHRLNDLDASVARLDERTKNESHVRSRRGDAAAN